MNINIYKELYKDFQNLYYFYKNNKEESDSISKKIESYVKNEDYESLNELSNTYDWLIDYDIMTDDILKKLKDINKKYTKKYFKNLKKKKGKYVKYPIIFILFKKLIINIDQEKYIKANKIKNKILNKF